VATVRETPDRAAVGRGVRWDRSRPEFVAVVVVAPARARRQGGRPRQVPPRVGQLLLVHWFTPDGRSSLAYQVLGGLALTTSEPFGVPDARPGAVDAFARFCTDRALTPCLYAVGEQVRAHTAALGWDCVQVAEEAVIPLGHLTFTGKRWQDVRTALNKATRQGVTTESAETPILRPRSSWHATGPPCECEDWCHATRRPLRGSPAPPRQSSWTRGVPDARTRAPGS
jgi:phosphatidylglycerol lysyltransferase-like protein